MGKKVGKVLIHLKSEKTVFASTRNVGFGSDIISVKEGKDTHLMGSPFKVPNLRLIQVPLSNVDFILLYEEEEKEVEEHE